MALSATNPTTEPAALPAGDRPVIRQGATPAEGRLASRDELLTVPEVAERLKLAPRTIRKWIAAGELPATRLGAGDKRPVRVSLAALDQYVNDRDELAKTRSRARLALPLALSRRQHLARLATPRRRVRR